MTKVLKIRFICVFVYKVKENSALFNFYGWYLKAIWRKNK